MSEALIEKAFQTLIKDWAAAQSPAVPVAYERVPFVPPEAAATAPYGRYVAVAVRHADARAFGYGHGRDYMGFVQLTVSVAEGVGTRYLKELKAQLDSLLPTTAPIVEGALRIWITSPLTFGPAIGDPGRYTVPLTVNFRAPAF